MQRNKNSSAYAPTKSLSSVSTRSANIEFLDHWAWEFYAYTFATLFAIFALSCFVAFVQQWTQPSRSRSIHGRFTTVQLFIAATLKVVGLLWSPIVLHNTSTEIFTASLLIDCFSVALSLSAFSILLLILLETTKTSLAVPRLQNIWVLLGITSVLTAVMLTLNLLALFSETPRRFWYFVSHAYLFIWGILICVGYTVAGYRMWRTLKSSRRLRRSAGEGRLKRIITLVFLSPFVTAATLILNLCLAGSLYGILKGLEITEDKVWVRYAVQFLRSSCDLVIMVSIFGIVIRTKSQRSSADDEPALQMGTFADDTTTPLEEVSRE